ncbi:MAG: hypothetical protein ACSLFN_10995 [Candidatus Limnocylindrales bacterium]
MVKAAKGNASVGTYEYKIGRATIDGVDLWGFWIDSQRQTYRSTTD